MFRLTNVTPDDELEVEYLLDLCFAPGRTALSSYRLRDGVDKIEELSLVARDDMDILAGSISFWPVQIGVKKSPALLLGPIAVHPTRQGEGVGAMLMNESLERAQNTGWSRVILVGDAPYYQRFGFSNARFLEMPPPTNPDRLLCRALQSGAFDDVGGKVERYDLDA